MWPSYCQVHFVKCQVTISSNLHLGWSEKKWAMDQFQIGRWYLRWTTIPIFGVDNLKVWWLVMILVKLIIKFLLKYPPIIMIPPIHDLLIPTINLSFAIESWGPIRWPLTSQQWQLAGHTFQVSISIHSRDFPRILDRSFPVGAYFLDHHAHHLLVPWPIER